MLATWILLAGIAGEPGIWTVTGQFPTYAECADAGQKMVRDRVVNPFTKKRYVDWKCNPKGPDTPQAKRCATAIKEREDSVKHLSTCTDEKSCYWVYDAFKEARKREVEECPG